MKPFNLVFAVFTAVALSVATVNVAAEQQIAQTFPRRQLIERWDTDGDGKLSIEEREALRDFITKRRRPSPERSVKTTVDPSKTDLYKLADGPLEVDRAANLELRDEKRDKTLPLRITLPKTEGKYPIIVFSHGALGSKDVYQPLITYWASHGYVCIQPTHGDSLSLLNLREKLKIGSAKERVNSPDTLKHWRTRPEDVAFILDHLDAIASRVAGLEGKLDKSRIGMGGHSFGAHTTQMIAGLSLKSPLAAKPIQLADPRPRAFLMISPQGTGRSTDKDSWRDITRPAMVITGSKDDSVRDGKGPEWRLEVYENMPPPDKYLVFIKDAYHGFGGIVGKVRFPSSGPANPDHVYYVKTTSLAFWDAYLKQIETAKKFLQSEQLQQVTGSKATLSHKQEKGDAALLRDLRQYAGKP